MYVRLDWGTYFTLLLSHWVPFSHCYKFHIGSLFLSASTIVDIVIKKRWLLCGVTSTRHWGSQRKLMFERQILLFLHFIHSSMHVLSSGNLHIEISTYFNHLCYHTMHGLFEVRQAWWRRETNPHLKYAGQNVHN